MIQLPKSVLSLAAGALALGTLLLTNPKAAHALAATFVQVTNTSANPATAEDISKMASQNVLLVTYLNIPMAPGGGAFLSQRFPDDTVSTSQFVVPAGQSLVVTTIDVFPGSPLVGTTDRVAIGNDSTSLREKFTVSNEYSTQLQFPSGFVFAAGNSVEATNYAESVGPIIVTVHGYLTTN